MVFKVLSYMDIIIHISMKHIFPQNQVTQHFLSGEKWATYSGLEKTQVQILHICKFDNSLHFTAFSVRDVGARLSSTLFKELWEESAGA